MSLDAQVLACFLREKGHFISGTAIGEVLGLSRVSVHNHLESLKREGFEFSAIRNKGYRLESEPFSFHPALFTALLDLNPCPFYRGFETHQEVSSTNSLAEIELARGRDAPFVIIADSQSAGRGRRGRTWHSPVGRNIYLSVALRPAMPPARLQSITLWLGLRLCQYLRDRFSLPVMVKWPNDLILHDKKIAGVLSEARVDSEQIRDLVFGLGLNINGQESDFPPELREIAGSLSLVLNRPLNATRLTHEIIQVLASAIQDYLDDQYSDELARAWPEFDYLRGQSVSTGEVHGRVLGISSNGSLRLELDNGSVILLHSGEVSIGSAR